MKENLKVKIIVSQDKLEYERLLNEFAATNVDIVATQSVLQATGNGAMTLFFMATIYYKPRLPSLQ